MKYTQLLVLFLFLFTTQLKASIIIIKGNASKFKGKELTIYTYSDYISNQKTQIGFTTIQKNGSYSFKFEAENIKKVFFNIEDKSAWFFVQPGKVYNVNLDYNEEFNKGRIYDKELSIIFNFPVPNELNQKVIKFNQKFDLFIENNEVLFEKRDRSIEPKLKEFKIQTLEEAKSSKAEFITDYIRYSLTLTQLVIDVSNRSHDAKKDRTNRAAN